MPYEFKRSDVYGLASALGAETHERGEELFFRWCPYCKGGGHDKNTFSVNLENGTFKCFRAGCGAQGHLVQLARDFGYPLEFDDGRKKKYRTLPQRPVKVTNPAVRYLESRGISRAVTERYRITTQRGHDNILVFPFYDGDGMMQFVKYRKTDFVKGRDRNKEWSEKDTMPILFGMDRCEGKDRLVITEGQIDSLSLTEAGIQNAVSVPTGAMGFTWLENVWEWINGFAEVIVFGDCEKGKITLVDALSRRLPKPVKVVRQEDYLGEKDANDILRKYGTEALRQAVANARIIPVTHIKELANWLDVAWDTRIRGTVQADSYTPVNRDDASSNPIVFVPRVTSYTLGLTGSSGSEYFKQWLIWVCKAYPNKYMLLCIGTQHPNSVGVVLCHIYNTLVVNAAGLPEYATGKYFALGGGEKAFGTVDYNFYLK